MSIVRRLLIIASTWLVVSTGCTKEKPLTTTTPPLDSTTLGAHSTLIQEWMPKMLKQYTWRYSEYRWGPLGNLDTIYSDTELAITKVNDTTIKFADYTLVYCAQPVQFYYQIPPLEIDTLAYLTFYDPSNLYAAQFLRYYYKKDSATLRHYANYNGQFVSDVRFWTK